MERAEYTLLLQDGGPIIELRTPAGIAEKAFQTPGYRDVFERLIYRDFFKFDDGDTGAVLQIHPESLGPFDDPDVYIDDETDLYSFMNCYNFSIPHEQVDPRLDLRAFFSSGEEMAIIADVQRPMQPEDVVTDSVRRAMDAVGTSLGAPFYEGRAGYTSQYGMFMSLSVHSGVHSEGENYTPDGERVPIISNNVSPFLGEPLIYLSGLIAFAKPELILES